MGFYSRLIVRLLKDLLFVAVVILVLVGFASMLKW